MKQTRRVAGRFRAWPPWMSLPLSSEMAQAGGKSICPPTIESSRAGAGKNVTIGGDVNNKQQ